MTNSNLPMQDRLCLVTGATGGIGKVTARALAEQGAHVIVVGRNPRKGAATVEQIQAQSGSQAVEFMLADLSSLAQIRSLAQAFQARHRRLHVLVNNAGGFFMRRQESVDGFEMTLALNHLSYFLLTHLLLGALKAAGPEARIVNVSSGAHQGARLDLDDLQMAGKYSGWQAYARSKLCNLLFTYELARRLAGDSVTVNALHPGYVATNLGAGNLGVIGRLLKPLLNIPAISPEEGAQTSIYLATAPQVAGVSGQYFIEQKPARSSQASYDETTARRLWRISEELTGLV